MKSSAQIQDFKNNNILQKKETKPFFNWGKNEGFFPGPVQAKLSVGPANDIYEKEADAVADAVMRKPRDSESPLQEPVVSQLSLAMASEEKLKRKEDDLPLEEEMVQTTLAGGDQITRKCSECEKEKLLNRKTQTESIQPAQDGDAGSYDTSSVESTLSAGGQPLDAATQQFMEDRFGYDFSSVQIHNDSSAHRSSADINALAYTHQNHIAFAQGQYQPETDSGKHLLAHELTHVVQQNPGIGRKKNITPISGPGVGTSSGHDTASTLSGRVQCYFTFAPDPRPKGSLIHSNVLPEFAKSNSNLFVEVKIPGANKKDVDTEKVGVADFYVPDTTGGKQRTIGLRFVGGEPDNLPKDGKLDYGGGAYDHSGDSAPKGSGAKPKIKKIDNAPTSIHLGDLKPGASAEAVLGMGQLSNYKDGIKNTAKQVDDYLKNDSSQSDSGASPKKVTWPVTASTISNLTIPPALNYPGGKGTGRGRLALYNGEHKVLSDAGLVGSMFVYKDKHAGIWSYEWIPDSIPASTGSGLVNKVLDRLNKEVIPSITAANKAAGIKPKRDHHQKGKTLPVPPQKKTIQRKDTRFSNEEWERDHYKPWKGDAETFLGQKDEVKKAQVAEGLVDLEARSGKNIGLPAEVKERGEGLGKIGHWKNFGKLYGWLREKFDWFYVKFQGVAKKVKDKLAKMKKSVGSSAFGSWVKAVAKVIFKIFKMVGAWVVSQTVEKLVSSLQEGISNNIKKVAEMFTPEGVKSKIEEFYEKKEEYEAIIKEQEDLIFEKILGVKPDEVEKLFDRLSEFEAAAETASNILALVEWGVRLLACASPPAIGCLWNLAISALQAAFSWLMQTCWFTKKVYAPVINEISIVKNFPAELAATISEKANSYIPMPAGFDPLFAKIEVDSAEFKPDCDEGGDGSAALTPERAALMKLFDEVGLDKYNALLEMMNKRGAGPWVLMTADRIDNLRELLKDVDIDTLKDVAKDPAKGTPEKLEEFLKSISKYTSKEKDTAKKFFEDKKRREEAAGGGGGGEGVKDSKGGGGDSDQAGASVPEFSGTVKKGKLATGTPIAVNYIGVIYTVRLKPGEVLTEPVKVDLRMFIFKDNKVEKRVLVNGIFLNVNSVTDKQVVLTVPADTIIEYTGGKISLAAGMKVRIDKEYIIYAFE